MKNSFFPVTLRLCTRSIRTLKIPSALYFFISLLCFVFLSCEKESLNDTGDQEELLTIDYDAQGLLKKDFAIAFAKALAESEPLRTFIKEEALKMFDKDYDILYHLAKDQPLSDGNTLRGLLTKYYEKEERLSEVEATIPLLTIMVPKLPQDSFSAELWDVTSDIPEVAINLGTTNNIPLFDASGEELIVPSKYVPGFPVVVIKENERVAVGKDNSKSFAKGAQFKSKDGVSFTFLDDNFDQSKDKSAGKSKMSEPRGVNPSTQTAYGFYKNADGWQRDYVYYSISPKHPEGSFNYTNQEHITTFRMLGDAQNAFNKIADQSGDPQIANRYRSNTASGWTGGYFEFKATVLINGKNGAGSQIPIYFPLRPDELFNLKYKRVGRGGRGGPGYWYVFESIAHKTAYVYLPIFHWDLDQYSTSIKISVEEVDISETTTTKETRDVSFATNFKIKGTLKKVGFKFGASRSKNETQTTEIQITKGSDQLGDVTVNFADDIILGKKPVFNSTRDYITREYTSGLYAIGIQPEPVLWE